MYIRSYKPETFKNDQVKLYKVKFFIGFRNLIYGYLHIYPYMHMHILII